METRRRLQQVAEPTESADEDVGILVTRYRLSALDPEGLEGAMDSSSEAALRSLTKAQKKVILSRYVLQETELLNRYGTDNPPLLDSIRLAPQPAQSQSSGQSGNAITASNANASTIMTAGNDSTVPQGRIVTNDQHSTIVQETDVPLVGHAILNGGLKLQISHLSANERSFDLTEINSRMISKFYDWVQKMRPKLADWNKEVRVVNCACLVQHQ